MVELRPSFSMSTGCVVSKYTKTSISVMKSAKLLKSTTRKRNVHVRWQSEIKTTRTGFRGESIGVKEVVWANVKVTTKRLDYYIRIKNRE